MIDSYYDCKTCAYWLTEAMYQCQEKSCKQCLSSNRRCGSYSELNSPVINRCVPRLRDEDMMIECQFSACGCNFRATDRSQLIVHNEENIHRHMNVSVSIRLCNMQVRQSFELIRFVHAKCLLSILPNFR